MSRFKFNLEALLRLRELEEDRAKRDFFAVLRAMQEKEQSLMQLVKSREEAKALCRSSESETTTLDMEALLSRRRYINVLYAKIVASSEEIRQAQPELEKVRKALRESRRRRKIVEKIRERREAEFVLEENRRETRELDELGQVYSGRSGEESRSR